MTNGIARSLSELPRDATHAVRALHSRPAFTFTAVFSLALGIGANSAIFSVLDGLFLHPPAVERPGELVRVFSTTPAGESLPVSLDDFTDLSAGARALEGLAAEKFMIASLRDRGESQFVQSQVVSESYFAVLRPPFAAGRPFAAADYEDSARAWPAVISHAFWKRQFDGDPGVLGREVLVEGRSFTILGVTAERFRGMQGMGAADLYLPIHAWKQIDATNPDYRERDKRILAVYGRLRPATSAGQAQAELALVAERLARAYPRTNQGVSARVVSDAVLRVRSAGTFGWLLTVVIGLVLLMSCVNVANLLLAQAERRRKEFAIRLALGAGRSRLLRQLLAESLVLALLGCAVGLALAFALVRFAPLWQPTADGFAPFFAVDGRVLAFSLALAVVTSVLFGLVPAWRASKPEVYPELKAAVAARASGRLRVRSALIVGQLAVTLVLLAGTALMLQSLSNLVTTDLGFPRRNILTFWVHSGTRSEAEVQPLLERWVERVKAIPGVRAVSMARRVPLCPQVGGTWTEVSAPSSTLPLEQRTLSMGFNAVGLDFFSTLGIPLVEGRDFARFDTADTARVAIVSETFARHFWPGQSALGQPLRIGGAGAPPATVVGVARDTRIENLDEPEAPYFYVPRTQDYRPFMTLLVHAEGDPLRLVKPIRAELAALDPQLPSGRIITLAQALRLHAGFRSSVSVLLSVLGLVGLTLAVVGLYGIVAYVAGQRTRELGIRMALGAEAGHVAWLVLRQGLVLVALGIGAGLAAAAASTRLMGHLLYGVKPMQPGALAAASALLVVVTALACLVPARRAARTDPAITLRAE